MVLPTSNRPFINARSAVSLIPEGQSFPNRYTLDLAADANQGATQIDLKIVQKNSQAADAEEILELEDDHQIWLPGNQTIAAAAAAVIGQRKLMIDDASGNNPNIEAGDFIKFASHETVYRIGRVNGQTVRIFPALTSPIADNEAVTVYQEARLSMETDQVIDLNTTGISIDVASLKYAVTAANSQTLDVRAEKQLFGLTTVGVSPTVNSIDASDTRSPVKDFITGAGLAATIETLAMDSELARPEVILSTLLNTNIVATTGFYLNIRTAAGEIYQGPASPSQSASSNGRGALETFNITFSFNLDDTHYWLSL